MLVGETREEVQTPATPCDFSGGCELFDLIWVTCEYLGLPIGATCPPARVCTLLGITFDTIKRRASLGGHKLVETLQLLRCLCRPKAKVTIPQLRALTGRFVYTKVDKGVTGLTIRPLASLTRAPCLSPRWCTPTWLLPMGHHRSGRSTSS